MKEKTNNNYTIRIPNDTREKLEQIASEQCRTLADQIKWFIMKGVREYEESERK